MLPWRSSHHSICQTWQDGNKIVSRLCPVAKQSQVRPWLECRTLTRVSNNEGTKMAQGYEIGSTPFTPLLCLCSPRQVTLEYCILLSLHFLALTVLAVHAGAVDAHAASKPSALNVESAPCRAGCDTRVPGAGPCACMWRARANVTSVLSITPRKCSAAFCCISLPSSSTASSASKHSRGFSSCRDMPPSPAGDGWRARAVNSMAKCRAMLSANSDVGSTGKGQCL